MVYIGARHRLLLARSQTGSSLPLTSGWSATDKAGEIRVTSDGRTASSLLSRTGDAGLRGVRGTLGKSAGARSQFETRIGAMGGKVQIGIATSAATLGGSNGGNTASIIVSSDGAIGYNSNYATSIGRALVAGDVISYDFDYTGASPTLAMALNGVWTAPRTIAAGTWFPIALFNGAGDNIAINTGDSPFYFGLPAVDNWG
ncbi:MAG TPA: hypothetical protein VF638_14310 [Sphingomonas sp.]|jgi:hypothetical protein